jgi:flagellar basal-body rod protein FlgG
MINSLYIAETGLNAQKSLVDVISNNIANVNTSGFKKGKIDFVDLIYLKDDGVGEVDLSTTSQLQGVHISSIRQDLTQGNLKYTQHPFDLAIQGEGYIPVNFKDNTVAYTRVGRLSIDSEGYLTSASGYRLEAGIVIAPDVDSVVVTKSGLVQGIVSGEPEWIELGQIDLVRFNNEEGLGTVGEGLFVETEASGRAMIGEPGSDGFGSILQGYTEESNVSMVEEMVNLVIAQRGYQLNARVIQVSDQLLETINNLRR